MLFSGKVRSHQCDLWGEIDAQAYSCINRCGLAILAVGPDLKFDTANGQSLALEEIVVTARRREESLQDIPVSVTAFTADQIERAGFMTLERFD